MDPGSFDDAKDKSFKIFKIMSPMAG